MSRVATSAPRDPVRPLSWNQPRYIVGVVVESAGATLPPPPIQPMPSAVVTVVLSAARPPPPIQPIPPDALKEGCDDGGAAGSVGDPEPHAETSALATRTGKKRRVRRMETPGVRVKCPS